jgi:hypothetical protein
LLTKVLHWREVKFQYHLFCITISIMLAWFFLLANVIN